MTQTHDLPEKCAFSQNPLYSLVTKFWDVRGSIICTHEKDLHKKMYDIP